MITHASQNAFTRARHAAGPPFLAAARGNGITPTTTTTANRGGRVRMP